MLRRLFRRIVVLVATCGVVIAFFALLSPKLYMVTGGETVPGEQNRMLGELGAEAARNFDVPVAAILVYGNDIIGRGYNNVERENSAAGHAEINAISDALKKIGGREFKRLDRSRLKLVSTLEPCPMCRSAIMQYNIRSVTFLKPRSLKHWSLELLRQLRYEWGKSMAGGEELQDSLFRLHPRFDPAKLDL